MLFKQSCGCIFLVCEQFNKDTREKERIPVCIKSCERDMQYDEICFSQDLGSRFENEFLVETLSAEDTKLVLYEIQSLICAGYNFRKIQNILNDMAEKGN